MLLKKINHYCLTSFLLLVFQTQTAYADIENLNNESVKSQINHLILLDASSLTSCQAESVKMAKCLPSETFQSDKNILASFYHIAWVLGTSGLQGNEEVLVFADNEDQRDALISILYLAGQKKIWRWNANKSDLIKRFGKAKGQTRGIIRSHYYTVKMRHNTLVLMSEIESLKQQGWVLSNKDQSLHKPTIVAGKNPLDSLARFTQFFMSKTENHQLKILIHTNT